MERQPKSGDSIEFQSDRHTDKGPATGKIAATKITVDGLYVVVEFADGRQTLSWDDLEPEADVRGGAWMVKAHVKGYTRKGVYVRPHERGPNASAAPEPTHHPRRDDKGAKVTVHTPHHASAPSTWHEATAVATFVPGGDVPAELNGVPLRRWKDHPTSVDGWDYDSGIMEDLDEPPFHVPKGKNAAAGVIIEEPDGRVWLTAPTNGFGGYKATFPKGTAEDELSLQGNALKEAFEETGLRIRITGFIGDFERTTSVARMYRAVRVGGSPVEMGWESQAVHLCPKDLLYEHLNGYADHPVAEKIGAGPAPKQPQGPEHPGKWKWWGSDKFDDKF